MIQFMSVELNLFLNHKLLSFHRDDKFFIRKNHLSQRPEVMAKDITNTTVIIK